MSSFPKTTQFLIKFLIKTGSSAIVITFSISSLFSTLFQITEIVYFISSIQELGIILSQETNLLSQGFKVTICSGIQLLQLSKKLVS
ncbi:MAG: hypothetical protein LBC61_02405 [Candidatus Peribacteria bacterium]|jgi:hypothetical protein|nr:hypothetical protein [Candidatus Peribacteria bacterium]